MLSFSIDKNDLIRGVSITPRHTDGGFSPRREGEGTNSYRASGINLIKGQGGVLYPQPGRTDLNGSSVVTDNIIAFTEDGTFLGNDAYALDEDGNFHTIDGSTVTKRQTDSTNSYTDGTCDMVQFKGELFATAREDIVKLGGSDLASLDDEWWTTTRGHSGLSTVYRHPMVVLEDTLYIADDEDIHTWDGTTSVPAAMSIPSTYNITNMIAHTDGRHLLVFASGTANYSHTLKAKAVCYIIDTVNLEFIREIPLHSQVEGSINVGGVIYVTYGDNLGYFNGDGITFLRKLNAGTTYKHKLTNYEGILVVADDNGLLMYGDLGLGNVFWYAYNDDQISPTRDFSAIYYAGDNEMLVSVTSRYLDKIDLEDIGGATEFETNYYSFPGDVWIRKIDIEFEELDTGSDITFSYVDKNNTETELLTLDYSTDGAISHKEKFVNIKTNLFKLRLDFAAGNPSGIHKITVWYEDAE